MNTVSIIGRLTADPETTEINDRKGEHLALTRFRVAIDRPGEDEADFVTITAFGALAAAVTDHVRKGRQVAVTGRLRHSEWTTPEGDRRSTLGVTATSIDFLAEPRHGTDEPQSAYSTENEPF